MNKLAITLVAAVASYAIAIALPAEAKETPKPADAAKAATKLLDINTATKAELEKLTGIGPARAADIIKNRPYRGKDELVSRNVIPQNVYDGIKEQVIARQVPTGGAEPGRKNETKAQKV
jgi:competence protein ComEA